jgi:hypothetical protein
MGFKKAIPYIVYNRNGDYIEVKLKNKTQTLDMQEFDIKTEKGQRAFFQYVISKLGLNFKKYQSEQDTEYF